MGRYLAAQNVRCNDRDILIVSGAWQDHISANVWHKCENENVPPATTVQAGSIIEYDLPQERLEAAMKRGVLVGADTDLHFDLDRVFDGATISGVNAKVKIGVADSLREWGIFSFEDLLSKKTVTRPLIGDGQPVPLRALLKTFGSDAQVAMWLRAAENIVNQSKSTNPTAEQTPPNVETVKEN